MTKDYIDNVFGDMDDFYPGSKRKRKPQTPPKQTRKSDEIEGAWDSQPIVITGADGKSVELFTVGALAKALNRSFIVIRHWNNRGFLPDAPYRMPNRQDKYGMTRRGNRLYSRSMIEYVVNLLDSEHLINVQRINWNNYRHLTKKIDEAWKQFQANETNQE